MTHPTRVLWTAVLALLVLAPVPAARSGEAQECPLTTAAKQLAGCSCCQRFKTLLDGAEGDHVSLDIYQLQHGLVVKLTGSDAASVQLIHDAVDPLWSIGDVAPAGLCPDCKQRHEKLLQASRDRAFTEDGAIVVLSSADAQMLKWLEKDARQAQELVRSVSTSGR